MSNALEKYLYLFVRYFNRGFRFLKSDFQHVLIVKFPCRLSICAPNVKSLVEISLTEFHYLEIESIK